MNLWKTWRFKMYSYSIEKKNGMYFIFFYRKGLSICTIEIEESEIIDITDVLPDENRTCFVIKAEKDKNIRNYIVFCNRRDFKHIFSMAKKAINEIIGIELISIDIMNRLSKHIGSMCI